MKKVIEVPEFGYGFGMSTDLPHPNIVTPIPSRRRRAVVDLDPNDEPPDEEWDGYDSDEDDPQPLYEIFSRLQFFD